MRDDRRSRACPPALRRGALSLRHDRAAKPLRLRLAQPLIAVGDRAHFPGEADLAEGHQVRRHGAVRRGSRRARSAPAGPRRSRQISMPPTTFTNTSCSCSETPAWRLTAASSIATRLASSPCAMRRGAPKRMRSTSACSSISSGRPPSRVTVTMLPGAGSRSARQEDRRRVAHLLQPAGRHGEEAELVHRAEAVLGGAHDAVAAARLALEIQHRVDQVLEQPRAGDRALLGDVADDDDCACRSTWRSAPAPRCTRAAAMTAPAAGPAAARLHRLDRVDDQQRRPPLAWRAPGSPAARSRRPAAALRR